MNIVKYFAFIATVVIPWFVLGYIIGTEKHGHKIWKKGRGINISEDELIDEMMKLVEKSKKYNKKISISEDRNGIIISCEDLISHEEYIISKIEYI